ncbi:hypothetical protein HS960_17955 [Sphingobacterium paramultivorum]|uniref:Uncharacterized protein n=1 Tax=Sphingobacterium paramultivorum TaxID=2886510 RepID=A0A7G5E5Z5_9SPHI|nr:hypothetical protein [Sphingobacterium paramultivorum]QMV69420.1 hypothetical protein HS960_17955 [Sphingobacterium paramultivorum]WSO13222.1 hypothetical protein VUL84_17955 [Sphingobacterium paramultivorum]
MKDKKLKELEEKYFNGQSSLEEERALKNSDNAFFQSLNQEKNETMDWSFEDFQSEINDDKKRIVWWNNSWIKYAATAMLVMAIGIALFLNQEPTTRVPVLAEKKMKELKSADKKLIEDQNKETVVPNSNDSFRSVKSGKTLQIAETVKHPKVKKQAKEWTEKKEIVAESLQSVESELYQADYVVLNGKPVANEQEAVELTLKSLGLLANNLENGVDKAMNIKQMSITIN